MNLLKSHIQVEFKVKESSSGLYSDYEILIQQMQIDEKIKHDRYQSKEVINEEGKKSKYATLSYIKEEGVNHHHIIRLYASKQGEAEWRIGVDVHGYKRER